MDIKQAYNLKQQGKPIREIMRKFNIPDTEKEYQKIKKQLQRYKPEEEILKEELEKENEAMILKDNRHTEKWQGEKIIRFGVVSDTHLCNKWSQVSFLNYLYDIFYREQIPTVYHAGDMADGWYKTRDWHVFELIPGRIGLDEQADYIIEHYPRRKNILTKYITGNHDHTHIKNGGGNIGKRVSAQREDMIYLGHSNAKVELTPNCLLEINHPEDGASYAQSYALQKLIDSMTGGDKPNILLNGHHHKAFYIPKYRNIHSLECGTTEAQTPFMKSKRIASDVGGWICEATIDKDGTVLRFKAEFIPLYKPDLEDWKNWR